MAKGNMFQGMARGKVGDVVFSRLNGQQISRVRNRAPKNPKTDAQLIQRAVMATIMQAYSAGAVIFDHSFQGKAKGAENMREFMKVNAKKLRAAYIHDINTGDSEGRYVAPGAYNPTPFTYIVSDGNYNQSLFDADYMMPTPNTDETIAAYADRVGLIPGDLYTLVGFVAQTSADDEQPNGGFFFIRMQVKDSVVTDGTAITINTNKSALFDVTASSGVSLEYALGTLGDAFDIAEATTWDTAAGAFGIIRSRVDQDLRSRCELVFNAADLFGITSPELLNVWRNTSDAAGQSELILEGGASGAARASEVAAAIAATDKAGAAVTIRGFVVSGGKVLANLTDGRSLPIVGQNENASSYGKQLGTDENGINWVDATPAPDDYVAWGSGRNFPTDAQVAALTSQLGVSYPVALGF